MKVLQFFLVASVVFLLNYANAQVASSCVHLTEGKNSRLLKNICEQPITVFMCHDAPSPVGTSGSECGRKGHLYQMHFELSPGESGGNQFESPFGSTVAYGACFGSIFAKPHTVKSDAGAYECKVLKKNMSLESTTSSGKTQVEACGSARVAAGSPAAPCSCSGDEGKRVICKVTALREKHQLSATEEAREAMRQILKEACAKAGDCSTPRTSSMANRG